MKEKPFGQRIPVYVRVLPVIHQNLFTDIRETIKFHVPTRKNPPPQPTELTHSSCQCKQREVALLGDSRAVEIICGIVSKTVAG